MGTPRTRKPHSRRGFSYAELLVSALILVIAVAGAFAHWSFSVRMPAIKRVQEMGVYIAVEELERVKARRFLGSLITPANAPVVSYYTRNGVLEVTGDTPDLQGYKVKTWITSAVDRDGAANTEDLREVTVEVWDRAEANTNPFERVRTLLSFGGI